MRFYVFRACVAVLALVLVSGSLHAEWTDTFNGGFDQSWDYGSIPASAAGSDIFYFDVDVENDMLVVGDTREVNQGGAASGFGLVNESFSEVVVGAVTNPGNDTDLNRDVGVLARIDLEEFTGYAFTIDYSETSLGAVTLSRINGEQLDLIRLSGFEKEDSVYLRLQAVDDNLVGRVYDQMGGTLLGEIDTIDDDYTHGLAGVVVSRDAATFDVPLRGTFDNVTAAVPEPSSIVILLCGGLGAFVVLWRRR